MQDRRSIPGGQLPPTVSAGRRQSRQYCTEWAGRNGSVLARAWPTGLFTKLERLSSLVNKHVRHGWSN